MVETHDNNKNEAVKEMFEGGSIRGGHQTNE